MDLSSIVGLTGGHGPAFFEILAEEGRGKTKYWPSIKNGKELTLAETALDPDFYKYKVERERYTIRFVVAGNAVSAESVLIGLGYHALSTTPNTVDVYINEEVTANV